MSGVSSFWNCDGDRWGVYFLLGSGSTRKIGPRGHHYKFQKVDTPDTPTFEDLIQKTTKKVDLVATPDTSTFEDLLQKTSEKVDLVDTPDAPTFEDSTF